MLARSVPSQHPGKRLEQDCAEDRPAESDERRVRRPLGENRRGHLGADVRAERKPGEGQRTPDESSGEPVEAEQENDADDDPVGGGHRHRSVRTAVAVTPSAPGYNHAARGRSSVG